MPVPREILAAVRTHLDVEIQSGRRRQPLDRDVVAEFLGGGRSRTAAATRPAEPGADRRPSRPAHAPVAAAPARPPAATAQAPAPAAPTPPPSVEAGSPAEAAAAAPDVAAVAAAVRSCRLCALAATRTKSVPGVGNADSPEVMFVGEAPGRDEDLRGEPFVGRAGQLLDKMIVGMGFSREEVFIANVLKCRPPDNRTPTPEEMARCLPFLRRQIALVRPKTIVALGATAYRGLVGDAAGGISAVRGLWQSFDGIPLMPTFHPAYLLRAPAAKRVVWEDLKKVLARLGRTPPPVARQAAN